MMRNTKACLWGVMWVAALASFASGWIMAVPTTTGKLSSPSSSRMRPNRIHFSRPQQHDDNDDKNAIQTNNPRDLYVLSWDGCLVDTVSWRTDQGLAICRQVWPDLEGLLADDDDCQWLYNKVRDLHHVLVLDPHYSPTVEYALLIRMLLEEQELDQGRSIGSRGKYGSKYHPTSSDAFSSAEDEPSFNRRQQRPLTVGEIAANWQESLREAVLIRYYQEEGQNPLDLLQKALATQDSTPNAINLLYPDDFNVLRDQCHSLLLMVPHESDLPFVEASLKDRVDYVICKGVDEAFTMPQQSLAVLCRTKHMVKDILECIPSQSSLTVLESSWPILQTHIRQFGDCVPRQTDRPQPCDVPQKLLRLSLWRSKHPNDQAAALMNAWTFCCENADWPKALLQPVTSSR